MGNIIYVASVVVISAQMAMAQAYKWVDENGVIHFSDKPHTNAEIIYLNKTSPQTKAGVESTRLDENLEQISTKEQPATRWYESIEIVSPSPEETLWNLEGVLHVTLFVTPALQKQDRIRVARYTQHPGGGHRRNRKNDLTEPAKSILRAAE